MSKYTVNKKDVKMILNLERIFNLLNIRRNNPTKYQYYYKFLKALKNKPMPQELIKDLVQFYVAKE